MNAEFFINGKTIETSRLILRPFMEKDLDDFYEYASKEGVGEKAGWSHHKSIADSKMILDMFIKEDKTFAIVDKNTNVVIGSLGVEEYGMEDKLTEFNGYKGRELGFVLSKDYWGKGLMPEAVNAVIDYLFNECDFDFLICGYYNFNSQSKRVQEKCGFKPYRSLILDTRMGTKEESTLNLLLNPSKNIVLNFSNPDTLIYEANCLENPSPELWDAYDNEFNKISGITLVRGNTILDGYYHLVCEIIVKHIDGTYLLMQRDLKKHKGGLWELSAGGSALKGENPMMCAIRELKEETGIDAKDIKEITRSVCDEHHSIIVEFLCITDCEKDSVIFQKGETINYQWVDINHLLTMDRNEIASNRTRDLVDKYNI